jgi:hypothetical protein
MPRVICPRCDFTLEGAAAYARTERCPRCTTALGPARRLFEPAPRTGRQGDAPASSLQPVRAELAWLKDRGGEHDGGG